jgi:hypothetical protein
MTEPFYILAAEYRPMVLAYLTGGGKEPFEPITPNGMVVSSVVVD